MNAIIQEIKSFPELKSYILINNYTGEETIVSEPHLISAFGKDGFIKIKSGRSDYWILIDNVL